LNGLVLFDDYKDSAPYLFDSTGRFVTVHAGFNWVF